MTKELDEELDEEDLEIIEEHELAGDTGNPSDYIFAINSNSSIGFTFENVIVITPRKFWQENHYQYDQHLLLKIEGFHDLMEGIYEYDPSIMDPRTYLINLGLEYSEEFQNFLDRIND